jgi:hypothetical protein
MDERCRGSEARRLEAYFLRIGEYKEKGETIAHQLTNYVLNFLLPW